MSEPVDISVVISTHNRCALLTAALEAVLKQKAEGVCYEVVVVDNNSTDGTREVVEAFIDRGHTNLRYFFEPRQGISYGRNAGIATARADIIAFTDDDVVVTPNWVATIKRSFDENHEIAFVGGKILPQWDSAPPPWLTREHWWPLALLDYGDSRLNVNSTNPLCLPTANASFRREVFSKIGRFRPEFSSREDHELFMRLWHAGLQGLYEPDLIVLAKVQPERLLKSYHRRWNRTTGKFNSLMRLDEMLAPDGSLKSERHDAVTLFGVPAVMYWQFVTESTGWVKDSVYGSESRTLQHENRLWYLRGYVSKRYEETASRPRYSTARELWNFLNAVLRKRIRKHNLENLGNPK